MSRVLFINGGSEGHINPTIGVVQELISRGEEVVYVCIEAYRERIEKTGAMVLTFDDQTFIQAFISGGRSCVLERINGLLLTADVVIPSVLEQIEGQHFDYVIHDSMFGCGRILARMLKLPAISSCSTFAQTEEAFERMLKHDDETVHAEALISANKRYQHLTASVKQKYGADIQTPYEVFCNPAPLTIVYTTRAFQPDGEAFDSSYTFTGPSISGRADQESLPVTAIEGKSIIYISLGTVFNRAVDFYKLCIEALGNAEHTVVMSIGSKTDPADLGEIPANFIVKAYVPQTELLRHTTCFITHGGMNSTHEALYEGVPLLVIPQSADQPIIARQVAAIGAGIVLRMQSLTAAELRESVNLLLRDSLYKQAATAMQQSLRTSGGANLAVDEIFSYLR